MDRTKLKIEMSELNLLHFGLPAEQSTHGMGFLRLLRLVLRIVFATCWIHSFNRSVPAISGTLPEING